jgi:hypothetical protein
VTWSRSMCRPTSTDSRIMAHINTTGPGVLDGPDRDPTAGPSGPDAVRQPVQAGAPAGAPRGRSSGGDRRSAGLVCGHHVHSHGYGAGRRPLRTRQSDPFRAYFMPQCHSAPSLPGRNGRYRSESTAEPPDAGRNRVPGQNWTRYRLAPCTRGFSEPSSHYWVRSAYGGA